MFTSAHKVLLALKKGQIELNSNELRELELKALNSFPVENTQEGPDLKVFEFEGQNFWIKEVDYYEIGSDPNDDPVFDGVELWKGPYKSVELVNQALRKDFGHSTYVNTN